MTEHDLQMAEQGRVYFLYVWIPLTVLLLGLYFGWWYQINHWLKVRFVMWLGYPLRDQIQDEISRHEVEKLRRRVRNPEMGGKT